MKGCVALFVAFIYIGPVIGSRVHERKEQSAWPELSQWLVTKGGWVQDSIQSDLASHGGAMIRGLVTHGGAWMGSTLIEIPRHLWLELQFWPDLAETSLAHHKTCNDLSKKEVHRIKFASGLARETRKGNASEHSVYMRNLPTLGDYKTFHPSFMNAGLQEDFRSLPVADFARRTQEDEARMKGCFVDWQKEPQSPVKDVTWDEMENGLSHLRNRGFIVEDAPLMVPVVDLINTERSDTVNAQVEFNMDMVSLVVSSAWVGSDEELLYGYCQTCDNDIMLYQWGVFLEGNTNPLPEDHTVDCDGNHAAVNASSGHAKSIRENAFAALDVGSQPVGTVPRCKESTFASEQGPLRCSLARIAWEYCGHSWEKRPGAVAPTGVFLKAKKNSKAIDWANMVDNRFIPLNATNRNSAAIRNISHSSNASQQRVGMPAKSQRSLRL